MCTVQSCPPSPSVTWTSDDRPRHDHQTPDWITATEFQDVNNVLNDKVERLAALLKLSKVNCKQRGKSMIFWGMKLNKALFNIFPYYIPEDCNLLWSWNLDVSWDWTGCSQWQGQDVGWSDHWCGAHHHSPGAGNSQVCLPPHVSHPTIRHIAPYQEQGIGAWMDPTESRWSAPEGWMATRRYCWDPWVLVWPFKSCCMLWWKPQRGPLLRGNIHI